MRPHDQDVSSLYRNSSSSNSGRSSISNRRILPSNYSRSSSSSSSATDFNEVFAKQLVRKNGSSPLPTRSSSKNVFTIFKSFFRSISLPFLIPTCRWMNIPKSSPLFLTSSSNDSPNLGRKVTGTLFGHKRGHVSFAVQEDPGSEPVLLLELATSTSMLVKEMSSGLVRIALECEKRASDGGKPMKLFQEPMWTMYCNGKKCGYAISRTCRESDWHVFSSVPMISAGAGVIPSPPPSHPAAAAGVVVENSKSGVENSNKLMDGGGDSGELMYMRARFERVVGNRDSEAFYMLNPDGMVLNENRSTGRGAIMKKSLAQMGFNMTGGLINWFPGHMASATRAIRDRLKLADFVIEVRDSRIPISSINGDLQNVISSKRRVIALNKKDLANPNIMHKWSQYFDNLNQDCISINAHSKNSVKKLLELVELKLKEVISREPTLLVMVVGVPNVGKSSLINTIHQIASTRFPVQERTKRATVGPLPGVTLNIAGSVKDSVVGEERLAQYLLAILNYRSTPLHWKHLNNRRMEALINEANIKEDRVREFMLKGRKMLNESDLRYIEDLVGEVQRALYMTLSEFDGNLEDENDLESLIESQFTALQKALKISSHKASNEARTMVSKKFLTLFRMGKLGPFTLDDVPEVSNNAAA